MRGPFCLCHDAAPRYCCAEGRVVAQDPVNGIHSSGVEESPRQLNYGSMIWSRLNRPHSYLWLFVVVATALAIVLRLVALDSDPYARLSWSSALLTDEGFYIHNARNLVLFGTARTDEFNNMLIMPT